MQFASLCKPVNDDFQRVDQVICQYLDANVTLVEKVSRHIINSGGKRLRPLLALLAARTCGYEDDKHVTLAAAVEFIHTATLLHDDVVDTADLRRGQPTANNKWGNACSVLVGDFLYSRAFQMLVAIGELAVMRTLSYATSIIAEGEVLQLLNTNNPDTTEQEYWRVILSKTAMLFSAASKTGAQLAHAPAAHIEALYLYGQHLGIAFQLIDDMMDYTGDRAIMGKNVGNDLAEGKVTLPLIHAMANIAENERRLIRHAICTGDTKAFDVIQSIINTCGSLDYTRQMADQEMQKALQSLDCLPVSEFRQCLVNLCQMALVRNS